MEPPSDSESYLKGYEDAMRAAGRAAPAVDPITRVRPRTARRKVAERVGEGLGYAFGWLILFPVFVGLFWGVVSWLFGGDFATWAVMWGGLAFLFALFAGAAIVGWRLFIAYWPIILVGGVVIVAAEKLFG